MDKFDKLKSTRYRVFQQQIDRLQQRLEALQQLSSRLSWLRALVFFAGLALSGLLFWFYGVWWFSLGLLISVVVFAVVVTYHQQIEQGIARHRGWQEIKETQMARMRLDWANIPALSQRLPRYEHPFEADLDLLGGHSLHQLLDTTVSVEGSQRLRAWLTAPIPDAPETIRRQQLVRELIPLFLFRHKLILNATVSANTRKIWDAKRLMTWLERPAESSFRGWLLGLGLLAGTNLILLLLFGLGLIPAVWQYTLVLYFGLLLMTSGATKTLFHEAVALQDALKQLNSTFRHLEQFSYRHTPSLKGLCAPFLGRRQRPSNHLSRINRLVIGVGLRQNPMMWLLLNALLPWDIIVAYRLEQMKATMAQHAPTWLNAWFELEALSALANLAYLNPGYTLPQFIAEYDNTAFVFHTKQLGHPLIPDAERVNNDFTINNLGDLTLITGSNMAGKSTFLRTVGINLALAYAGGPVNAQHLQVRLFRLFTCIKVSDSVTDGTSYFYAEVKRLKALLVELRADHPLPLFFFIDEIFRGTNNRERLIGSRAYVRALVDQRGVGLISTHDLELTKLADQAPNIKNYHFRDDVENDQMVFDYTLRPGPCPTTNALKIMRMEGLPVK